MAVQPAGSRASPGGEASQGDEGRDAWEEMQQGGMAYKLAEELQRTLDDIGCPRVGAPVDRTHLTGQAWKDPDDVDDQPPALAESSDEELQEYMGQQKASNIGAPEDNSDDELGICYDWDVRTSGLCRGAAEQVLGTEWHGWDPVAWALATGSGSSTVDPSERKLVIRNGSPMVYDPLGGGEACQQQQQQRQRPQGDQDLFTSAGAPRAPSAGTPPTGGSTRQDGLNTRVEQQVWKAMSAAKLRAEAKRDAEKKVKG